MINDQRKLAQSTRIEYNAKWSQLIEPKLGTLAVRDLTPAAVRTWFASLDATKATRNRHAYGILSMICNTAVRDGLLDRNPCDVRGAMSPQGKKKDKTPTTVELHGIADKLGADPRYERFRVLVLLAGWCGLRFGEVSELRRQDLGRDCTTVTVSRAVRHRRDPDNPDKWCRINTTKTGEERIVTIPPHIRDDVREHLARHVGRSLNALLFEPARGGCHLNDRVFNKDVFQPAAKDLGIEDISSHDLRHFAGTKNAAVSSLAENMARLGHKTVEAALRYQHSQDGRDAIVAANLSANALAELAETTEQNDADA